MDIEWKCDGCGQDLITDSNYAGAKVECPKCMKPLIIPNSETSREIEEKVINLFPITMEGKDGYVDVSGSLIIPPQFQSAHHFSHGLGRVCIGGQFADGFKGGKWGFVDGTGSFVVRPDFDSAGDFSEGLAAVEIRERWGFIDNRGTMVINPQFYNAGAFAEGLAVVREALEGETRQEGGMWGYIDRTGTWVIKPQFHEAHGFHEGLALVTVEYYAGLQAYIDRTGSVKIKASRFASNFYDGMAKFQPGEKDNSHYGYIDKAGNTVIPPQFDSANNFSEGLAAVGMRVKAGYDVYDEIQRYDYKWRYIDKLGRTVIGIQFLTERSDHVGRFSEGLAWVCPKGSGGKFGYINRSGNIVIEPQFDFPGNFRNGLAGVCIGETITIRKTGYIDKKGKYVWTPTK